LVSVEYGPNGGIKEVHKPLITSVKTLGDWIRASQIAKNLTPGHLAAKMGIAHAMIRSWEDGTCQPGRQQVADLIKYFGQAPPNLSTSYIPGL
jgi:DNA-binding transcriptional regulator YiaG